MQTQLVTALASSCVSTKQKCCTGEQQQQFKELEAHLNKYIEDKFAEKRLGTIQFWTSASKEACPSKSLTQLLRCIQVTGRHTESSHLIALPRCKLASLRCISSELVGPVSGHAGNSTEIILQAVLFLTGACMFAQYAEIRREKATPVQEGIVQLQLFFVSKA